MPLIYGMHDAEGAHLVPAGGWCLALVSLSDDPRGRDYRAIRPDINWLHRINWGYGRTGTIPLPGQEDEYLARLMRFLRNSQGVERLIIGNEPNHEQERPNGEVISPERYVRFYNRVHAALLSSGQYQVAPAPIAPYHANPQNCMDYWRDVLQGIEGADFLAGHAYVRSTDGNAVYDRTTMAEPLTGQWYAFFTYRDQLSAVPSRFRHLPFHITEFCPVNGWEDRNTGLIQNAFGEVNWWNGRADTQKIASLHPYRFPTYDKWGMQGKEQLLRDYQDAVQKGFSNDTEGQGSTKSVVLMPSIKKPLTTQPEPSTPFERKEDPRAVERGVRVQEREDAVWRVKEIQWYNEQEADRIGPDRHILLDALDEQGKRVEGQTFLVSWPSGFDRVKITKTEPLYGADFGMSPSRNDYSVRMADELSETVTGIGMGQDTPSGFNPGIHTTTRVVFQKVAGKVQKETDFTPVSTLLSPVPPAFQAKITQYFGENKEPYPGLKGHTGLDYAVPQGTQVFATDAGKVIELGTMNFGYGIYVKLLHAWGESLYAHLSGVTVKGNDMVQPGQPLGFSGNSGTSTGPHLHFAIRRFPYDRSDGYDGFSDPLPLLRNQQSLVQFDYQEITNIILLAAHETGMDKNLLLSLAWAESSFRSGLDDGLYQIGDDAWKDHGMGVPLNEKRNPVHNAMTGARYLRFLLGYFGQDLDKALIAWNFGIGNVINGVKPPAITLEFVNKVKHGRDLLSAVGF